ENPLVLLGHADVVYSASFSPDGSRVLTASSDRTARVWDLANPANPLVLKHGHWVSSASFSPDGSSIMTGSMTHLRVWDLADPENSLILKGPGTLFPMASFGPDGSRVLTPFGASAVVWDLADPANPLVLWGPDSGNTVEAASFSPDGSRVLTASDEGTVRLWTYRPKDLQQLIRSSTNICLRPNFRQRHLGETREEATHRAEACMAAAANRRKRRPIRQ
ncbi:MAG: hypothetical protein GY842_13720, partial [bacterium]|nr:hypothetical protein [bacterium]